MAVVHPVDEAAREQMLSQGYGNPFVHHLTWGIRPPARDEETDFEYAGNLIPYLVETRRRIGECLEDEPGTLIMALPESVVTHPDLSGSLPAWLGELGDSPDEFTVETMQGVAFWSSSSF